MKHLDKIWKYEIYLKYTLHILFIGYLSYISYLRVKNSKNELIIMEGPLNDKKEEATF